MTETVSVNVWLVIGSVALLTYTLRLGGLLLAEKLPKTGRFKIFMDALPGTILLSLIVPGAVNGGFLTMGAAFFVALLSMKTGNVFLSMVAGVGIVAWGRLLGF